MYWIAFTLGFFGSLHCLGMCGPLIIATHSVRKLAGVGLIFSTLTYNLGRTLGYIILGLAAGILGSVVALAGAQKGFSVAIGVMLIAAGIFSVNPDNLIGKIPVFSRFITHINQKLSEYLRKTSRVPAWIVGLVNGFLPCGLVYIGIAGAASLNNIWGSAGFMLFFGLGTMPAMTAAAMLHGNLPQRFKSLFRNLYPAVTLLLGIYMVYRGLMSRLPLELDFFEALRNPVMCH